MSIDMDFYSKKTGFKPYVGREQLTEVQDILDDCGVFEQSGGFIYSFKYKIPKEIYHKLPFTVPDDVDDLTVEFG